MIHTTRSTLAFAAALVVAGCSSGGDAGSRDAYGTYVNDAVLLGRERDLLARLDAADLPTSGTASYEGVARFGARMRTSEQVALAGTMELTVDFAGPGEITGRIHDIVSNGNIFTDEGEGPVSGELGVVNGRLERNPLDPRFNPHFNADLVGSIVDHIGPLPANGRIRGDFFGENREMIDGNISGGFVGSFVLEAN